MRTKTLVCALALAASGAAAAPASAAEEVGVGYCTTYLTAPGSRLCRFVATSTIARFNYYKNTTCGSASVTWTVIRNTQSGGGSWDVTTIPATSTTSRCPSAAAAGRRRR
jgi:hypothetical protein